MKNTSTTDRIIFGLKVKQLRLKKKLSFAELSSATGMSLSYLNEIEKGKKFPKEDKVSVLARVLDTDVADLTNGKLGRHLAPVESLLRSNFLNELPLDLFGIELNKVVELVAGAPVRVAAFISTLLELSRSYNLREENFYFGALRSYLELHENFFPDIEAAVETFSAKHNLPASRPLAPRILADILEGSYGYKIETDALAKDAELGKFRSVFLPNSKRLLLQEGLKSHQATFQYGKELAFNYLKLGERANTSSLLDARSFEEVINHSKAIYFSAALHLPLAQFAEEVESFFAAANWDEAGFMRFLQRYNVNPETLYHRLTNVIPHRFGFSQLFFLRFVHNPGENHFAIDRELHLDQGMHPRGNSSNEHYCRRWLSTRMLLEIEQDDYRSSNVDEGQVVRVQRSRFFGTGDEYLCISIARKNYPRAGKNVSATLGLLVNDELRKFCNWIDDPVIPVREVNATCERCPIQDCAERVAAPIVLEKKERLQRIKSSIETLDK